MSEPKRIRCQTCVYWKQGDPADLVGNKGVCTWALGQERVPNSGGIVYQKMPFWMSELARTTNSFEGENCVAHRFVEPGGRQR